MKPSIDRKTQQYLDSLAQKPEGEAEYSYQNLDTLDKLIFEEGFVFCNRKLSQYCS